MRTVTLVCLLVGAGSAFAQDGAKPYPIFTGDQLDATMKTVGPNVSGVRAALGAGDLALAKERAIRAREQLATTVTFWRDRERDDAVRLLREVLEGFDALDTALSQESPEPSTLDGIAARIGAGCAACHAVYREQDPASDEYRLNDTALR